MNYIEMSKYIKEKFLEPLESYEIQNLQDIEDIHDKLIKIREALINQIRFDVMPHYRGEQKYGWDILSGIFRPPFVTKINLDKVREIEKKGIELFKKKVIENYGQEQIFKYSTNPYEEDWNLLFQAQHAGVKTNLIDLTTAIERASFFMTEPSKEYDNEDGQLWCLLVPTAFIFSGISDNYGKRTYPQLNPFDLKESFVCNVPSDLNYIDEKLYQFRLFRQHGRLFASSNSEMDVPLNQKEFWRDMMFRVRVPAEIKKTIFAELQKNGIDRERMMIKESDKAEKIIKEINNEMLEFA
jgi:hypothetical protein